jgi:hypothetical protein
MFWDSSAVVPLLVPESWSSRVTALFESDPNPFAWWTTPAECLSAIYRRHRRTPFEPEALQAALARLEEFVAVVDAVMPSDDLRRRAGRLLAVHPLRAADGLQLSAAIIACEEKTHLETIVCLDQRLRTAALSEGFSLQPDLPTGPSLR